jgi:DNA-binding transcriptional regulator YhcF (GntR family)
MGMKNMYIQLDFESETPIYEQLKNEIIIGIAKKELQPGERLPSVRSLASDIGINLHTVNKAYQQLKQDGFLLIHRQKGVVVNPEGAPKANKSYEKKLREILRPLIATTVCKEMTEEQFKKIIQSIYSEIQGED